MASGEHYAPVNYLTYGSFGYLNGPPMHNGWTGWLQGPDFADRVEVPSFTSGGTTGRICPWCSAAENGVNVFHTGPCPRIKAIEYHPDGTVKRVEFNEG